MRAAFWVLVLGCAGDATDKVDPDAPDPDVAGDTDTDTDADADADTDTDTDTDVVPSAFRGIPERPYADVELPAVGDVAQGSSTCIGTPEQPAFLIGDGVEFTNADAKWELDAQYCIVANIDFRGRILARTSTMVEFRNVSAHDADGNCLSLNGSDIAVVDSHFHHCQGDNGHGVQPGCGSERVWVTGTLLEYNDEDGFQSGHQCTGMEPDALYFYGNTCNNNRENCFDLKWTDRAVVSGNTMQRHLPAQDGVDFQFDDGSFDGDVSSGSDGSAVVVGSDGTPNTVFFFDNDYHDNMVCVRVEDAVDVYASGELCTDALPGASRGGYVFDKSGHTRLVGSTFRDVPYMLTTDFRDDPVVDEADNVLEGSTQFRQGNSATVTSGAVDEGDIAAAYEAVFGRPL